MRVQFAPAALSTIGIRLDFTLTPGDSASFTSVFVVQPVPEPASIALDTGDPAELGRQYAQLKRRLPQLNVLGGCCGTDTRHVASIAAECAGLFVG
jgi:hypothetical protein